MSALSPTHSGQNVDRNAALAAGIPLGGSQQNGESIPVIVQHGVSLPGDMEMARSHSVPNFSDEHPSTQGEFL